VRLLALMRYGRENATTRQRLLQFVPALAAAGIHVDVKPLWDPRYLRGFFAQRRANPAYVLGRFARRVAEVAAAARPGGGYDGVWLDTEALPYLPSVVERALRAAGVPVIADYDDAVWVKYAGAVNPAVRAVLGRKIERVMRSARVVIAGNAYIAEHARAAGARDVVVVPTVVDPARYPVEPERERPPFRVGYIGTPHTAGRYLERVVPALQRVQGVKLVVVGADVSYPGVMTECIPWSEESEAAAVASFHVGIMPLPDDAWERGKCGYKIIQTLACARPAIASPVGVNTELVRDDAGILATDTASWIAALERLAGDPSLRARMGAVGRARVEASYSTTSAAPLVVDAVMRAVRR
jgi:glycosyltransferase involved in cell wall biosynthesis